MPLAPELMKQVLIEVFFILGIAPRMAMVMELLGTVLQAFLRLLQVLKPQLFGLITSSILTLCLQRNSELL
jgi:hypothetical protein